MNAPLFAVTATLLAMLCGTAGAETMDTTKTDPLAVPVSGHQPAGERAAQPWTPERLAKAEPKPVPQIDPAVVRAAAERLRSGRESGPEDATAPLVLAADQAGPFGAQSAPGGDGGADYWTAERMRAAKPMPLPTIPEGSLGKSAGPKNR